MDEPASHDPYAALRHDGFRRYLSGNLMALVGYQMQTAAVGWEVYDRTKSTSSIALVGLIQFLPVLIWSLPAGTLADRFDRRRIVQIALGVLSLGSLGLAVVSWWKLPIELMYALLLVNGMCRAIQQPAKAAIMPQILPRELFANALTWHGSGFQLAMVSGPLLTAAILAFTGRPAYVYVIEAVTTAGFVALLARIEIPTQEREPFRNPLTELAGGLSYVWRNRIILSAISLDMFAVLLGGSVALSPVFCEVVIDMQAELGWMQPYFGWSTEMLQRIGYGLLRAAPALGALVMSLALARRPPLERPGRALLWSVVGFGVATIVFGFSRSFWLSFLMIGLTGAFDMISVVIRHSLVQLLTPDSMRGRVSAVNGLFIGASNELGAAESGYVAKLFDRPGDPAYGPIFSVVSGGLGTLLVVGVIAAIHPELRRLRKHDLHKPPEFGS